MFPFDDVIMNSMVADDQATRRNVASTAMMLTQFFLDVAILAPEGLRYIAVFARKTITCTRPQMSQANFLWYNQLQLIWWEDLLALL